MLNNIWLLNNKNVFHDTIVLINTYLLTFAIPSSKNQLQSKKKSKQNMHRQLTMLRYIKIKKKI